MTSTSSVSVTSVFWDHALMVEYYYPDSSQLNRTQAGEQQYLGGVSLVLDLRSHNAVWVSGGCCNTLPQTQWLKHHRFIIVQFQGPEVLNSRCRQGSISLGNSRGESISLTFPAPGGTCIFWFMALSFILKVSSIAFSHFSLSLWPLLTLFIAFSL